ILLIGFCQQHALQGVVRMYRSLLILAFLLLFGSFSAHVAGQATGAKNQTLKHINNPNDPIPAAPIGSPAATERNAEANRLYIEGMKLSEATQFSEAAEAFQQAIRLDPEFADAYSALGRAYFRLRPWQKAIDNLRGAAELTAKERQTTEAPRRKLT